MGIMDKALILTTKISGIMGLTNKNGASEPGNM
jgi:hypothetical protein